MGSYQSNTFVCISPCTMTFTIPSKYTLLEPPFEVGNFRDLGTRGWVLVQNLVPLSTFLRREVY